MVLSPEAPKVLHQTCPPPRPTTGQHTDLEEKPSDLEEKPSALLGSFRKHETRELIKTPGPVLFPLIDGYQTLSPKIVILGGHSKAHWAF